MYTMELIELKDPFFYKIVRPIIKCFVLITYRPKIIGKENILIDKPLILAGNHTHYFDSILLISSTKRCIRFLAKDSLYKGIKKVLFKNMGIIPVNRKTKNKKAVESAEKVLINKGLIGIFPESTINRTKDIIMPFKIGAVKMASDTNSYIVPFSITGKYKLFKNELKIIFEKPYKVTDENLEKENQKLMNTVSNLIKRGRDNGNY